MAENSQWRLPALSDAQKHWLIDARATGMSFEEITAHFREVYPNYATDIPEDVFPPLFTHRVKTMLNSSQSSAKFFLEAKQNSELPINVEALPLVVPHVRLLCYQRLWDDTPARTLQRVVETAEGEVKVYKENTRERLAILTEFRKELQLLGILAEKPETPNTPNTGAGEEVTIIKGKNPWDETDANT